jgi:phage/plasmid-associated DNA primase
MASSLERLSDNSSRWSWSRLQTSSVVRVATSESGEGWLGEAASLEAFVSNDLTPEA